MTELHSIASLPMRYMDHSSFTQPTDCIMVRLLYKLPKIPKSVFFYLCWWSIKPKHLHRTYLKPCIQNHIQNLTTVCLSDYMRFDDATTTTVENSWTGKLRFLWKEKLYVFGCSIGAFTRVNRIFELTRRN